MAEKRGFGNKRRGGDRRGKYKKKKKKIKNSLKEIKMNGILQQSQEDWSNQETY